MSRMTFMRSWKSLRLTSHTWLGLNPQIGRPLSRIVVPLVYFIFLNSALLWSTFKIGFSSKKFCVCYIFARQHNFYSFNLYTHFSHHFSVLVICNLLTPFFYFTFFLQNRQPDWLSEEHRCKNTSKVVLQANSILAQSSVWIMENRSRAKLFFFNHAKLCLAVQI
jgi:hypothetical protein